MANIFKIIYCRTYQAIMYVAMRFLYIRTPKYFCEENCLSKIDVILSETHYKKPLVVTDNSLYKLGLVNPLLSILKEKNINHALFYDVEPNPSTDVVLKGLKIYQENNCDCIISFGGGSSMDAAKIILAKSVSKKSISKMKGNLKIHKKLPLHIAIPTTAGTGSETTLASVISDHQSKQKYPINDPCLVPHFALLDPNNLLSLPGSITSTTGMDALTHAVEAYIGRANTRYTKKKSLEAIKLIFENLENSYANPKDITYRKNMLLASFYAGVSFTRAYVGYVHSVAHSLGAYYNVAHGLANAIILPIVLEKYGKSIYKKIGKIVDYLSLCDKKETNEYKTKLFISKIKEMNNNMNIINNFKDKIIVDDIPELIQRANKEANPLYPVPKIFDYKDFEEIYISLKI